MTIYETVARRHGQLGAALRLLFMATLLAASLQAAAQSKSERALEHLEKGKTALQQQQYMSAAVEFRKAAELSDDVEVAQQATRIAYTYGFNEDALASARRWVKLEKDSDEALLYVAQLELRLGEIRRARRDFKKLLERGSDPVDERLPSLISILSQEDPKDAYEVMRRLAAPYKDSASAHYAVAAMALQADDAEAARERAQKAIELDPDWIQPQLAYGRALLAGGDVDGAIDHTARIIGDDPDPEPEARLELAIMYLTAGRDDDALSQVNQILLEQPARTDALRLMAIINFRLDHLDAARDDFQDLYDSGRYRMDALYYLGRIADRREELDAAIQHYSKVTRGNNAVVSQRRVSGILSEQGETDAAVDHLRKFAAEYPHYAVDMVQAEAQLLASLERYPEALSLYDKVVAYRPDSEAAYLGKAELLLRMDRLDDAIAQYRYAVKRWPDSANSLNALGYTLADRTDRSAEAMKLIKKALALEPGNAAIIDSHGWVLYRTGDYDKALSELEKAYALFRDPEVAAHIVEVLWKLERNDEARQVLDDAEQSFPDNELLEAVRERAFPDDK